jgi:NAD(P)-dependent dehydrogenase (short-subunit alcohol dehydrogenase family)
MQDLTGRTAIVTGAASGIGEATALALAACGVAVVVADIDEPGARRVAREIEARGGAAMAHSCDVTDDDAFETLKTRTLKQFGRIDIVMNNAGALTRGLPDHMPLAEWRRIFDINLFSMVRSNLAFLPLLIGQGFGHIVNTASFAGLYTYSFDRQPYAAAKAAVVQMSEGLALYLRPHGVGVSLLCPGPVRTNIVSTMREFGPATQTRGPGPMFRLMEPAEVGEQVVQAIRDNRFLVPTDEKVRELLIARAKDWDGFLDAQMDPPAAAILAEISSNGTRE